MEEAQRLKIAQWLAKYDALVERGNSPSVSETIDQIIKLVLPKDKSPLLSDAMLKLIWFILDEIATKASARNEGDLSNRAVEAMRLIPVKPSPKECRELYERRR